jgi:putative ABC transport system permease protein
MLLPGGVGAHFMRMLVDIIRQSLSTLWALLLVGLGEGFRSGQDKNLAELGQDIMFVFPGRIPAVAGSYQSGQPYYLTYGDYFTIRDQSRFLRAVSPVLERDDIRAVSDYGSTNGQVFGVVPEYSQIRNIPTEPGRWFNDEDNSQHRRVAVVGWELLKNMFPGEPAVGSTILLNDMDFKVIGVIPKIGKEGENGTNHRIFVPFDTMRTLFPLKAQNSENAISFLNYRPIKKDLHVEAKNEVHAIIARRHGFDPTLEDAFMDWDTIDGAIRVAKIFDAMDWFLGVVGVVTLGLGAIGVINIMLVSVTERTREIGLRKALGATHRNIMTQFFVEGAFLTAFSGGIGIAVCSAFVALLAQLPSPEGFDTPRIVPSSAIAAMISLSIAGIVAGLYPARKAALLPPVEALRQE